MSHKTINKVLFKRYDLGDLTLSNRIVMDSLTRCRADPKTGIPTDLHILYYSQRASTGLIISEPAPIAYNGQSLMGNGGLFTSVQIEGWKKVTDVVHSKDSKIFAQLWHAGRAAHPDLIGEPNIGPSPIAIKGELIPGFFHKVPKEMTKGDIKTVIAQFKRAAIYAKEAGFDGVELHGASGYLVDQFLRDSSNHRDDEYGGSIENRAKFALEALDALIEVYGAQRVGIKLSPVGRYQDMYDSDPLGTYSYLMKELEKRSIAYVHLMEAGDKNTSPESVKQMPEVSKALRPLYNGTIIISYNQTPESGAQAIKDGDADLVSFAKEFVANPDFVRKVKQRLELAEPDYEFLYKGGEKGYIDYASSKSTKKRLKRFFLSFCFTTVGKNTNFGPFPNQYKYRILPN